MALGGPNWFWMALMAAIDFSLYLKFFVGLFAIINPLGLLPVFVSLTGHMQPDERRKTNTTAHIAVMVILMVSMCMGQLILDGFGISLASFRIAGGSLITLIAWSMLQGKLGEVKHNKQEKGELAARESIAVVPLALPLMAGPGAISSSIVYASQKTLPELMGNTGINVVTRIMGLIMMSLGIEIMVAGIKGVFPGLM